MASTFFNFSNPIKTQPLVDPEPQRQFVSTTEDKKEAPKRETVAAPRKPAAAPAKDAFDTEFDKYMSKIEPFATSVESAKAKALEAQANVDKVKSDVEMQVLQGKADEATLNAKKQREIIESQNKLRQEYPAFAPDVNNLQNLGKLFSLITTLGVMSGGGGKLGAQNVMAAMTGMLKGYNDGNEAEFTRQKAIFDENIKTIDAHNSQVEKDLKELMELQKSDYEAATIKREMIIRREGSQSIIGKQLELGNATAALETAQAKQRVAESIEKQLSDAEKRAKELAYQRETSWNRPSASGEGTKGGAVQFRYNNIVTNNLDALSVQADNFAAFPAAQMGPELTTVLTNPASGIVSAVEGLVARNMTNEEARAFQSASAGIKIALTNIEASGLPRGSNSVASSEYGKMEPKAGDSPLSKAMYMALIKQVANLGVRDLQTSGATTAQIARGQEAADKINKLVTWNVRNVIEVANKSKNLTEKQKQALISQSNGMEDYMNSIKSQTSKTTRGSGTTEDPIVLD